MQDSAKQTVYLTRKEVAAWLRLTPRQVDRMASGGVLAKQKLSARRSGFSQDGVAAYIASRNASPSASPLIDASDDAGYHPRVTMLVFDVEGSADTLGEVGRAADGWLAKSGFPGCIVHTAKGQLFIAWAWSLPYDTAVVRASILIAAGRD